MYLFIYLFYLFIYLILFFVSLCYIFIMHAFFYECRLQFWFVSYINYPQWKKKP